MSHIFIFLCHGQLEITLFPHKNMNRCVLWVQNCNMAWWKTGGAFFCIWHIIYVWNSLPQVIAKIKKRLKQMSLLICCCSEVINMTILKITVTKLQIPLKSWLWKKISPRFMYLTGLCLVCQNNSQQIRLQKLLPNMELKLS